MKVPRKLFRKALLIELADKALIGVPISKLIRDYELNCSLPHLSKHIGYYQMFGTDKDVEASLFPPWLNDTDDMQEEPKLWKYVGLFPWGKWITLEEWLQR